MVCSVLVYVGMFSEEAVLYLLPGVYRKPTYAWHKHACVSAEGTTATSRGLSPT